MTAAAWPLHWGAAWIWDHSPSDINRLTRARVDRAERYVMFRHRFTPAGRRGRWPARLRVTADGRYVLWLNGQELGRGPIRSEPGELYFDEFDLSGRMLAGVNVLAVLVRHYGQPVPWWRPAPAYARMGRGGLILESDVPGALATGEGWVARRGAWRPARPLPIGPPNEDFDARVDPGWVQPAFEARGWAPAVLLSDAPLEGRAASLPGTPFTTIRENPLPRLSGAVVEATRAVTGNSVAMSRRPGPLPVDRIYRDTRAAPSVAVPCELPRLLKPGEALRVDLGGVVRGLVEVAVEAPEGAVVTLRGGEHLRRGMVDEPERQWAHRHTCHGGVNLVAPSEGYGLRHLEVAVAGEAATVRAVRVREQLYPLRVEARFECDDEVLNRAWSTGVRTVQVCCTDAFLDCPGREQRSWTADSYLTGLLVRYLSADHRLADHALRMPTRHGRVDGLLPMVAAGDYTAEPDTIPSASLHWVRALARAAELGLSMPEVEQLLPRATGVIDAFMSHLVDGVLQPLPGWSFVEWWPVDMGTPTATMQGILLLAVTDHAALASALGQQALARRSLTRRRVLLRGMRRFLRPGGDLAEHAGGALRTQHGAAIAVLAGLRSEPGARRSLARAVRPGAGLDAELDGGALGRWVMPAGFDDRRHFLATQPYFSHFLHQALARAGMHAALLASLRRWEQFAGTGDGTFWEHWVAAGNPRSHAHAWSATPTYDLLAHTLGVTLRDGGRSVRVAPQPAGLAYVCGAVPTSSGLVEAEFEVTPRGLRGRLTLPPGLKGELISPAGHARRVGPGVSELRA